MGKICQQCGKPIYGKARKYCEKCKRKIHLEQMNKYYIDNTKNWQYNGKYWAKQAEGRCGTGSLGEHANTINWKKEYTQIHKEMQNLGLRQKKEFWRS